MKMSLIFSGSLGFDTLVIMGMQSVCCPVLNCILHHITGNMAIFVVEPSCSYRVLFNTEKSSPGTKYLYSSYVKKPMKL